MFTTSSTSRPFSHHIYVLLLCVILMASSMVTATSFLGSTLNVMNKIHSSAVPAIKMDDFKNSTFPEYSFIMGDFQTFDIQDSKCVDTNATFVKLQSSGNSITIATVYRPNDKILIRNCVQVKEDYHLCSMSVGADSTPACLKIDDDMKSDGEFKMAINLNPIACLDPSFDFKPKCELNTLDVISIYSYPGESATKLRNFVVVVVLILVCLFVCCIVTCGLVFYCCMIRRRKQKLMQGNINASRHDATELVDEE